MEKTKLHAMNREEIHTKMRDNDDAMTNLRFQKVLQQLENPQSIKLLRREVAQLKTRLRQIEMEEAGLKIKKSEVAE